MHVQKYFMMVVTSASTGDVEEPSKQTYTNLTRITFFISDGMHVLV